MKMADQKWRTAEHYADKLKVEYFTNPIGIDEPNPRFFWVMRDERRGARQTAYQIVVASGEKIVWDTGKVASRDSIQIKYEGETLKPRRRYEWKVRIWDERGEVSNWSVPAFFETGLMAQANWPAKWIHAGLYSQGENLAPAPFLRKEFNLREGIVGARLYITALGLYEAHLNGKKAGDGFLTPGWTKYAKRVQYQAYDVTNLLRTGENAVGIILADGWYAGAISRPLGQGKGKPSRPPKVTAQLVVDYDDGTTETVGTDASWRWAAGPIEYSDIYMGEKYDARKEFDAWDQAGFKDGSWQAVKEADGAGAAISWQRGAFVRKTGEIKPVSVKQPKPGVWVLDMGQNMVGWERLKVKGPAGAEIVIKHGEMLNEDGTVYLSNLRSAKATSIYILKGGAEEIWEPRFTFYGFQYLQVEGFPGEPGPDALTGIVVHSDLPFTGKFECSEPLINKLWLNAVWGQRGNFVDIPTDCPQRDERLGWTGDTQVFMRTAAFNMETPAFYTKWLQDLNDSQLEDGRYPFWAPTGDHHDGGGASAWADAGIICPWLMYLCYKDIRVLETHYAAMKKWMSYQENYAPGYIRSYAWFADWLNTDADTPREVIATAFFAHTADLMGKIALILGRKKDADHYQRLFLKVKNAFNREFVTPGGRVMNGNQTAYVLALHFNLLPEGKRCRAVEYLAHDIVINRKNHLSAGFVGSPYINHVLTRFGRVDVAYDLLNQKTWPSWLYAVTKGATTIWERWDGWTEEKGFQDPGMNSFNHYAYGAIGEWLYRTVAGIDLDERQPAYKHIIIHPRPGGGLKYARASYESIYGQIKSGWEIRDASLVMDVLIPANTDAEIYLPATDLSRILVNGAVLRGAEGIEAFSKRNGEIVLKAEAGAYRIEIGGFLQE
ncbi:MAG: family 78 glycoside hydrolase catalytic domain [Bacillota bacterium]